MDHSSKTRKYILNALIFGAISIGSYIALFMEISVVMEYFTKGGRFAVLPVATALYFSFMHGAFASNLISAMGLEAKKH